MYIFQKNVVYTFKIFICNINYISINIYMEIHGIFQNIYYT